jgi:hypothetical protein
MLALGAMSLNRNLESTARPLMLVTPTKEARAGIEPANSGFADRCLTTWLPRQNSFVTYFVRAT